ncbi:MAG: glycoside hydrolase family 1 protein [Chloroflexi bacterium]|nr:glycoside hydrolase family 1 protein [Chloroflexota bacterium]
MSKFPKNFLWGSSTNAQQFEGGRDEDGTGLSIADVRSHFGSGDNENPHPDSNFDDFKTASDHYHHLDEDIDLYGEMGFGIYRFSMSWTRIFPNGDDKEPNQAGLDFYDRMLTALERNHIQPICTLYAYDLPQALVEKYGGFLDRRCVDAYARYVDTVTKYFKGRIKYYVTFNEQNTMVWIPYYTAGVEIKDSTDLFKFDHHINLAFARAVGIVHENDPEAQVGGNICNTCFYPMTCKPEDVAEADASSYKAYAYGDIFCRGVYPKFYLNRFGNVDFESVIQPGDLELIAGAGTQTDFLSLTYYMSNISSQEGSGDTLLDTKRSNPYLPKTIYGWTIDPYGFYHYLMDFSHRYQKPILILENGMGTPDVLEKDGSVHDDYRIDYLRAHINKMADAIKDGVEMIGYCTWSATDLYSTHEGFEKRYGFVYVDKNDDLKRYRKDSFYWYKKVIVSNGEDLD